MAPQPKPTPVARASRGRLDSVIRKSPSPRGLTPRAMTPRAATPRAPIRPTKSSPQCGNPQCNKSEVVEDDGKMICTNCGFVVNEVNITQELTFGEAANGAAVVQGTYVGANEEAARNPTMGGSRLAGGMDSRQQTERNGTFHINNFVAALRLTGTHKERAFAIYKLAMGLNFIQGRVTRQVAAVCLYIACRRDPECKVMLIDFSELLEINVFKLGQIYNTLVDELMLRGGKDDKSGNMKPTEIFDVNPENLIQRFARDLEFGKDEHKIAMEAVMILKRMKRDWMLTGRRPAGVCAAALILAARMNNYRRTVREVVFTAKCCDITIHKRLEEFKYTDSSKLTVEEFRHHGLNLEKEHDPPAFYEQFLTKNKRRKKNHVANDDIGMEEATPEQGSEQGSVAPTERARSTMSPGARERADRAAMPPPQNNQIDPAILTTPDENGDHLDLLAASAASPKDGDDDDEYSDPASTTSKKRKAGRPKGSRNKSLPTLTEASLEDQDRIEEEVDGLLEDPDNLAHATATHNDLGDTLDSIEPADDHSVAVTEEDAHLSDLDDDEEVATCLLNEEEISVKEQIWVQENHEYLRTQQAKRIRRELAEKSGTAPIKKTRTRRRGRMGNGHWKFNEKGEEDEPKTPAEATARMLKHRGYSRKINYEALNKLWPSKKSKSKSRSRATSTADPESSSRSAESESQNTSPAPPSTSAKAVKEKEAVGPNGGIGLQTPQATAETGRTELGALQDKPIEIQDNGTPSAGEEDDEEDPDDYFQEGEELGQEEEQYEFGDDEEEY